ncbi:MAG: hypothetical protein QM683_09805 [Lacrimispora sp.]
MAECIVLKGGGADLDAVTAGASDVLAGKVIVGSDGEPLTGTMPNQGAVNQSLGINGTYTIPAGYHNGSGKVTQSVSAYGGTDYKSLCITANRFQLRKVYDRECSGKCSFKFSGGKYKKGAVVGGVTGTFEGYVPTATDLYLRGNNVKNFVTSNSAYVSFEAGQISLPNKDMNINYIQSGVSVSLVGFSYVNIQYVCTAKASSYVAWIRVGMGEDTTLDTSYVSAGDDTTKSINVTGYQTSGNLRISMTKWAGYIYRIWLS